MVIFIASNAVSQLVGYSLLAANAFMIILSPWMNWLYYSWILGLEWSLDNPYDISLYIDLGFSISQMLWLPFITTFLGFTIGR